MPEFFYFSGFCSGEISCSLLKLSNRKSKIGGVYYTPDITITNSDYSLLREINHVVCENLGVISKVKGAFNLSMRGKRKVKKVLNFFALYPPIAGDLVLSRLYLISKSIEVLESQKEHKRSSAQELKLKEIRTQLSQVKIKAFPISEFRQQIFSQDAIGYFLAGVLDAEGSIGIKANRNRGQPFVAVAMKDGKIIKLFKNFFQMGNIHIRPKEKMIHFEIGARAQVLKALEIFTKVYPVKMEKTKKRIKKVQRILNDYTLGPIPWRVWNKI